MVWKRVEVLNSSDRSLGFNGGGARPLTPEHGPPAEPGGEGLTSPGADTGARLKSKRPQPTGPRAVRDEGDPRRAPSRGSRAEKGASPPGGSAT